MDTANTTEALTVRLLQDFKAQYPKKYTFLSDQSLGDGAYGIVFKAMDNDRNIEVAIKLYHDGLVPEGSERGWNLTSKTINRQIAPTYTVESFTSGDKEYKAIVSRFIPGKTLKAMFSWCDQQSAENKTRVTDDLAFTFLPSLLDVLELCHSLGFGHGDLHEGNVMVFPVDFEKRFSFSAVLIDFDNSSIRQDVFCSTENEKIDKDVRLFCNRLGPYILMDWEWKEETKELFTKYSSIRDIKLAFEACLRFIEMHKNGSFSENNVMQVLENLAPYSMNNFSPKATVDALRAISSKHGNEKEFEEYFVEFQNRLKNPENMTVEVTVIEDGHIRNELYKGFFE